MKKEKTFGGGEHETLQQKKLVPPKGKNGGNPGSRQRGGERQTSVTQRLLSQSTHFGEEVSGLLGRGKKKTLVQKKSNCPAPSIDCGGGKASCQTHLEGTITLDLHPVEGERGEGGWGGWGGRGEEGQDGGEKGGGERGRGRGEGGGRQKFPGNGRGRARLKHACTQGKKGRTE